MGTFFKLFKQGNKKSSPEILPQDISSEMTTEINPIQEVTVIEGYTWKQKVMQSFETLYKYGNCSGNCNIGTIADNLDSFKYLSVDEFFPENDKVVYLSWLCDYYEKGLNCPIKYTVPEYLQLLENPQEVEARFESIFGKSLQLFLNAQTRTDYNLTVTDVIVILLKGDTNYHLGNWTEPQTYNYNITIAGKEYTLHESLFEDIDVPQAIKSGKLFTIEDYSKIYTVYVRGKSSINSPQELKEYLENDWANMSISFENIEDSLDSGAIGTKEDLLLVYLSSFQTGGLHFTSNYHSEITIGESVDLLGFGSDIAYDNFMAKHGKWDLTLITLSNSEMFKALEQEDKDELVSDYLDLIVTSIKDRKQINTLKVSKENLDRQILKQKQIEQYLGLKQLLTKFDKDNPIGQIKKD